MSDLYAVFGNPIAHSKSPAIHAAFARVSGEQIVYEARLAAVDGFKSAISDFQLAGGKGANVTVPFKEEAFRLCTRLSPRAALAGAVNTLSFNAGEVAGDNTDGAGLVRDIEVNLGCSLAGKRILLLGAGGASRGVIGPLLEGKLASLFVANRSVEKAALLAQVFADVAKQQNATVHAGNFENTMGKSFDLVINATSASLSGQALALPAGLYAPGALAYDMMYGKGDTPFMAQARDQGAAICSDGLGMLVEQAAEAFFVWRHVRPATQIVLSDLRCLMNT
jgi:shikimate dehydrogenase